MAWVNHTTGSPISEQLAFFVQFARALNEREASLPGRTMTQFNFGGGNVTLPTPAHVANRVISHCAREIAVKCQAGITAMIDADVTSTHRRSRFVQPTGSNAPWSSVAALLTAAGSGSAWLSVDAMTMGLPSAHTRLENVGIWNQIRAAFDLLTIYEVVIARTDFTLRQKGATESSDSTAWSNALSASTTVSNLTDNEFFDELENPFLRIFPNWLKGFNAPSTHFVGLGQNPSTWALDLTGMSGVCHRFDLSVGKHYQAADVGDLNYSVSFFGTVEYGHGDAGPDVLSASGVTFGSVETVSASLNTSAPSTIPSFSANPGIIGMTLSENPTIHGDISSALTYG